MHINPPPFFGSWGEYKKKIDVQRRSAFQFWFDRLVQVFEHSHERNLSAQRDETSFIIHLVLSTWTISEAWALSGFAAGAQKTASMNTLALSVCRHKERSVDWKRAGTTIVLLIKPIDWFRFRSHRRRRYGWRGFQHWFSDWRTPCSQKRLDFAGHNYIGPYNPPYNPETGEIV